MRKSSLRAIFLTKSACVCHIWRKSQYALALSLKAVGPFTAGFTAESPGEFKDEGVRDGLRLIGAGGNEKLVDAPQLTKIAPKILHSKGCFEAV
jgi:hypothetical protein